MSDIYCQHDLAAKTSPISYQSIVSLKVSGLNLQKSHIVKGYKNSNEESTLKVFEALTVFPEQVYIPLRWESEILPHQRIFFEVGQTLNPSKHQTLAHNPEHSCVSAYLL